MGMILKLETTGCFVSIALTILLSSPLTPLTSAHEANPKLGPLLKHCIAKTISNMNATEADYSDCFSKDFVQTVNGEALSYSEMVSKRLKAQNKEIKSFTFDFETLIEDGDQAAVALKGEFQKADGKIVRFLAHAFLKFKDGKIFRINEVLHRLTGGEGAR